jgi:hypothetical protein
VLDSRSSFALPAPILELGGGVTRVMSRRALTWVIPCAGVSMVLLLAVAASAQASTKFGANLRNSDGSVVEANANQSCARSSNFLRSPCTRVAVRFDGPSAVDGNVTAPRDGVIKRIQLVAQAPGGFHFGFARVRRFDGGLDPYGRARLVRGREKHFHYDGANGQIQTFHVHRRVEKGDYLAIEPNVAAGMLRCKPADTTEQLLFHPVLQLGDPFHSNKGHSSDCTVLMQAVYGRGS